jgi:hypothetical protein
MEILTGIGLEEIVWPNFTVSPLFALSHPDAQTVGGLNDVARKPLNNQANRANILSQLVDGQDTVADQIRLGGGKLGEDETGAVAEGNRI